MKDSIKSIISYRGFIYSSVRREFQSRYQSSLLGPVWVFIQPISLILIYTIVFSTLMKAKLPGNSSHAAYSIFLCSGIIFWNLLSEIIIKSVNVFVSNSNVLKKLNFPKICLPAIIIISSSINFIILFCVFVFVMLVTDSLHALSILYIIPLIVLLIIFAISLGMILGIVNVFFRDVSQFVLVFMQFWFWLTPIVYPLNILPHWAKVIVELNPATGIVLGSQQIFVTGTFPDIRILIPVFSASILFSIIAFVIFKKRSSDMVDEL